MSELQQPGGISTEQCTHSAMYHIRPDSGHQMKTFIEILANSKFS